MRPGFTLMLTALALLISIAPGISLADIGWPEAVGRLAGERSNAENCAAALKGYGDKQQISRGQLAYGEAKANFDGVIAELITALTEGGNPKSLPSLETDLEHSATALVNFCKMVSDVLPDTSGQRGVLADIVKGAVEPLIKALSEGVATIYNNHRKDDALTIEDNQDPVGGHDMAQFCRGQSRQIARLQILFLALALVILPGICAKAQNLYERPVLIVDPDMHTAISKTAAADAAGRFLVTGSYDKTVRIWSACDGKLLRTIRMPVGPGHIGEIYAVAMSPDGSIVAAGGWLEGPPVNAIYLFDRNTGKMTARIGDLPNSVKELVYSADGRYLAATGHSGGPLDPRDQLQASGAGVWRPLHGHRTEAGAS
jgi:hypothetical protein